MKHALRKYLSPCGSALFMVVSTMAALIVLVTAMYMSVLSSRQVQYATFDQEQAYVTSTSIADIVCSYIADPNNGSDSFVKKVVQMKDPGESISTNGNGFASLSATGTNDDTILGGYDVTVTKQKDETISGVVWHVYDVAVTASKNGIMETTHTFLRTKEEDSDPSFGMDKFFTATGYVPNDVLISAIVLDSTAYYDSEYVKFSHIESGYSENKQPNTVTIRSGLICAGSVEFDKGNNLKVLIDEPTDWYIGNNMTVKLTGTTTFDLCGSGAVESSLKRGRIFIGGDLDISGTGYANFGSNDKPTDIYVLGDVNISVPVTIYGNLYVRGNINITLDKCEDWVTTQFLGKSKIYQCGKEINISTDKYDASKVRVKYNGSSVSLDTIKANKWDVDNGTELALTPTDVESKLDQSIGGSIYPKWNPDIESAQANVRNIIFNGGPADVELTGIEVVDDDGDLTPISVYKKYENDIIRYSGGTKVIPQRRVEVIDSDCTIGDIVDVGQYDGGAAGGMHTIIFDTGDEGDVLTINLKANMCLDGSSEPNGFAWAVAYTENDTLDPYSDIKLTDSNFGQSMSVLTIGDGTLIVKVPEGVTYQAAQGEFFGHYAWFKLAGGTYNNGTFGSASVVQSSVVKAKIHDCDGCVSCEYIKATNRKGDEGYTCTTHGGFVEAEEKPDSCQCNGRVEKSLFTGDMFMYEGELQQGNVNIFLVSSDESADIQIGCLKYETGENKAIRNQFYGYVYAPYMTYMDMANSDNQGVKACGGLIVSDYIMSGYYEYVFALPDSLIDEFVSDEEYNNAKSNANRSWRVHGV